MNNFSENINAETNRALIGKLSLIYFYFFKIVAKWIECVAIAQLVNFDI